MKSLNRLLVVSSLLWLTTSAGTMPKANAQEVRSQAATTTITPQKRLLIKELLTITGANKNADRIFDLMLAQTESDFPKIITGILDKNPALSKLRPSERAELQQKIGTDALRISKRYRELLRKRVNFAEIVENISYPLYDKYFTENELKDLISFYQSPTGKKSISVMPQLLTDSMQRSNQLLIPKLLDVINEVLVEEFPNLKPIN